jgi:hypothetical protein
MTRKDFELIAYVIRYTNISAEARATIAKDMAVNLRGTNPRFDADRFIAAATAEAK